MPRDAYSEKESSLGLGNATLFITAAILTSTIGLAVILLSLVYGAITFHPTNVFAVCLEVAEKRS